MPSAFRSALSERSTGPAERPVWRFVAYDQLHTNFVPEDPSEVGILLVECPNKARRRPYHRQKLALVLANLRHFALEQAERGVRVRHVVAPSYRRAVEDLIGAVGPVRVARPAERELRTELAGIDGLLWEPHPGWLTSPETFAALGGPPWRMDAFYRAVRRQTGLLMDSKGKPLGGRFSYDAENRLRWDGIPAAPTPPTFGRDPIADEVLALVEREFPDHPGRLDPVHLPSTLADAEASWRWALTACLPSFGPYEDAMSGRSRGLFHTRISPLLNLHRVWPARVIADVVAAELPLPSKEGFVRQIIGWREFVRHVHEATDGLRDQAPVEPLAGDGGYAAWAGRPWPAAESGTGGAAPIATGSAPLPPAFWGTRSGLTCLDRTVADVWEDGWTHHIPRLMVLSNIAALLDVSPRELTDWFWVAFVDAYDWVVEPNVLAMGTYGVGDRMTTKPYVAGSAYISRMSDHCASCAFDPKRDCPLGPMYWAYLDRHRDSLAENHRMRLPLASSAKRAASLREADAEVFTRTRELLSRGLPLR